MNYCKTSKASSKRNGNCNAFLPLSTLNYISKVIVFVKMQSAINLAAIIAVINNGYRPKQGFEIFGNCWGPKISSLRSASDHRHCKGRHRLPITAESHNGS
jgi:hypothetical protein